jgi:hypothetical protein
VEFTPCEAFNRSSAVFIGRVLGGSEKAREVEIGGRKVIYESGRTLFAIEESFQGVAATEVVINVMSGEYCGPSIIRGEKYLVYASHRESIELSIGPCSPTKPVDRAKEDIEFLRRLPAPGSGGRILGRIGAEFGGVDPKPVAGVAVIAVDEYGQSFQVVTGASGEYEIKGLKPGKYTLNTRLPENYSPRDEYQVSREVFVSDRGCARGNFWVILNSRLKGRIVDMLGRPSPAEIYLVSVGGGEEDDMDFVGDDGEFEIEGIPSGQYVLYIQVLSGRQKESDDGRRYYYPGTYDRKAARVFDFKKEQTIDDIEFTLPRGLAINVIQGVVTYADGRPAGRARVILNVIEKNAPDARRITTSTQDFTTDDQGRFAFNAFNGNLYEVSANEDYAHAYTAKRQPLISDKAQVKLTKDVDEIKLILSRPLETAKPQAPPEVVKKP